MLYVRSSSLDSPLLIMATRLRNKNAFFIFAKSTAAGWEVKTFKCRSQFLVALYPRPSAAAGSKIDFNGNSWRGLWSGRWGGDRVTIKSKFVSYISLCNSGFFLTLAAKKTKTQAQNSSQKLKKKTQPQGGSFLPSRKIQGKNSILRIFLKKPKGLDILQYFYNRIFSKSVHFEWKLKFCTEF